MPKTKRSQNRDSDPSPLKRKWCSVCCPIEPTLKNCPPTPAKEPHAFGATVVALATNPSGGQVGGFPSRPIPRLRALVQVFCRRVVRDLDP